MNPSKPHALFARLVAHPRAPMVRQFLRFGCVGLVGLVLDTATVYGLRGALGLTAWGLIWAGLVAYMVAATGNWLLNRLWTFRGQGDGPAHRQWLRFMVTNLAGLGLNRGVFTLLVLLWPLAAAQPVIATSAGAIAGMVVNFHLSRRLVFR